MEFKSMEEIRLFALKKEEEAVVFYRECMEKTTRQEMKAAFLEMAKEEEKHRDILKKLNTDVLEERTVQEVTDLKISDYLVDIEFSENMDYSGLLVLAMKREEKSHKLYLDLAKKTTDPAVRKVFEGLAQEELKHKNRLEKEYDDVVMRWN
jgi:rubrerythrin